MTYKTVGKLLALSLVLAVGCTNLNVSEETGNFITTRETSSIEADNSITAHETSSALIAGRTFELYEPAHVSENALKNHAGFCVIGGLPGYIASAEYPYDMANPDLTVASADYALVGRVQKHKGARDPGGGPPHNYYDVTILEVIRGNLDPGQKISIVKTGGISEDKSYVLYYYNNDFMLEIEGVYIFLVHVLPDKFQPEKMRLAVMGPHGTVPLESSIVAELNRIENFNDPNKQVLIGKTLEKSEVYARYVAAAKKDAVEELPPHIRDRERYKSVYEK